MDSVCGTCPFSNFIWPAIPVSHPIALYNLNVRSVAHFSDVLCVDSDLAHDISLLLRHDLRCTKTHATAATGALLFVAQAIVSLFTGLSSTAVSSEAQVRTMALSHLHFKIELVQLDTEDWKVFDPIKISKL